MPDTVYGGPPGGAPETLRADDSDLPNAARIISDALDNLPDPYGVGVPEEDADDAIDFWDDPMFESAVVEVLRAAGYDSV